jgi:Transglutaminase-like superfamily
MNRLNKFIHLPSREKTLFIKACILLGIIRLGLSLLPFTTLVKVLRVISPWVARVDEELSEDQLVWAVGTASRSVPKATCLAQALTVQLFLKQSGQQASLYIGVNGSEGGHLNAHAWVESKGKVITGGPNPSDFTSLLTLE